MGNATATMSIRVDAEVKKQAESLFEDLGLNMTTAVNIFLRQVISHDGLPFKLDRKPNARTLAAIKEAEALENDPNAKTCDNVEELFKELRS